MESKWSHTRSRAKSAGNRNRVRYRHDVAKGLESAIGIWEKFSPMA